MVQCIYMKFINENKIIEGLERFNKDNGYFPTKIEIEECEYLPSSMSIYRKLGDLTSVRTKMKMLPKPPDREKNIEALYNEMSKVVDHFKKIFANAVIDEKYSDDKVGKIHLVLKLPNVDPIAIQFFSARTVNSLGYTVRTLSERFDNYREQVIFVCIKGMTQTHVQEYLENRKKGWLPDRMSVLTSKYFQKYVNEVLVPQYNSRLNK